MGVGLAGHRLARSSVANRCKLPGLSRSPPGNIAVLESGEPPTMSRQAACLPGINPVENAPPVNTPSLMVSAGLFFDCFEAAAAA